jgi:hypothetical protein
MRRQYKRAFQNICLALPSSHCHGEIGPEVVIFACVVATRPPDQTPVTADSNWWSQTVSKMDLPLVNIFENFHSKLSPILNVWGFDLHAGTKCALYNSIYITRLFIRAVQHGLGPCHTKAVDPIELKRYVQKDLVILLSTCVSSF